MRAPHLVFSLVTLDGSHYRVPTLYGLDGRPVDAVNAWFRHLLTGKRYKDKTTVEQYSYSVLTFFKFLFERYEERAPEWDWTRTTNGVLRLWRSDLLKRMSNNTALYHRNRLFDFLEWAAPLGWLKVGVASASELAPPRGFLSRHEVAVETEYVPPLHVPRAGEIESVLAAIAAHTPEAQVCRNLLILRWASEAGLRNTEIRNLTMRLLPSIGRVNNWAAEGVTPTMRVTGKGSKTRDIEPPSSLLRDTHAFLEDAVPQGLRNVWKSAGGFVFFKDMFAQLGRQHLSNKMSWYFKVAGVDGHLHRARAYYTYRVVEQKVRELSRSGRLEELQISTILRFVADRIGHADLSTLRHYVNIAVLSLEAGDPPIFGACG